MMHENSLYAFAEISVDNPGYAPSSKERRASAILEVYANSKKALSDYDVLQALFPGASDMNLVRPRISEMLAADHPLIMQVGRTTSHTGNRPVRVVKYILKNQITLF
jgi:hypothetical protein